MGDHRLTWPNRAGFLSVVADGDDEIELDVFEFVPGFTGGVAGIDVYVFQELDGERMDRAGGLGAGAVGLEATFADALHRVFGNDTAGRVARAEKQDFERGISFLAHKYLG